MLKVKMTPVALLFPGQGTQKVGMGKEFHDASPQAKKIFVLAETILEIDLRQTMFEGPQEKLTQTSYCQPAIVTHSIAALRCLRAHEKYQNIEIKYAAGLSLGEYSALMAAGALDFEEGLRLVKKRGALMEQACRKNDGAMAAIIGYDKTKLIAVCQETGAQVANFNSHEQIVITGHKENVTAAAQKIESDGAKSVIPLTVAGAFHSTLMQSAADQFKAAVDACPINEGQFPVLSNVDAKPTADPAQIKTNLPKQITSSVQWVDTIELMVSQGITTFLEIGPGRVLKGLIRKINPNCKVFNIQTPFDISKLEI